MWTEFFREGGWGMYPTTIFSIVLLIASILHLLRPEKGLLPVVGSLGAATLCAGLLGATLGIVRSFAALPGAPENMRLSLGALGCAESLHNLVLALMVMTLCALITALGSLRGSLAPRRAAA